MARFGRKVNSTGLSVGAKIGIAIAAVAVLAGVILAVVLRSPSASETPGNGGNIEAGEDTVIHFVAGGDVNITDQTIASGKGAAGFDFTNVFMDIAPLLAAGDLTAVNFEGNLAGAPYGSATGSAPPELMTALKNAGLTVTSVREKEDWRCVTAKK